MIYVSFPLLILNVPNTIPFFTKYSLLTVL